MQPDTNIFKKRYKYSWDGHRYQLFIKKHILSLKPTFYSVATSRHIETSDGPMFKLELILNALENPEHDPIAECWVNNEYVYMWNNKCWSLAVNRENQDLIVTDYGNRPTPSNRTITIYEIGSDPIE